MVDLQPFDFLNPFSKFRHYGYHELTNFYSSNWNDYEKLGKLTGFNYIGIPARVRRGELEAEENHRYWNDFAKNTGISLDDIKYPIRAGLYSSYGYLGNNFNTGFHGVTSAAMRLYHFEPHKDINNYHEHYYNINNYGDYHKYDVKTGYFD